MRLARVLRDLGPGLSEIALRCCCYLEGLETAEKRMGWSARSGKIVLRIFEGASVQYIVALTGGPEVMVRVPSRGNQADLPTGTGVVLTIPADRVFVAPEEGAA